MGDSNASNEDEPPDPVSTELRILRWEDTTPELLAEICHYKSNGNWRDIQEFFARALSLKDEYATIRAKRDGGEDHYLKSGYLEGLSFEPSDNKLPSNILLIQQDQDKDRYAQVPIDRITSVKLERAHA